MDLVIVNFNTKKWTGWKDSINKNFRKKASFFDGPVKKIVISEIEKNFQTEGRPGGGRHKWEKLSLDHQHKRAMLGFPAAHPILNMTGSLRNEVLARIKLRYNGVNAKFVTTPTGLNHIKAVVLNRGLPKAYIDAYGHIKNKPANQVIPARPWKFITKTAHKDIAKKAVIWFFSTKQPK